LWAKQPSEITNNFIKDWLVLALFLGDDMEKSIIAFIGAIVGFIVLIILSVGCARNWKWLK